MKRENIMKIAELKGVTDKELFVEFLSRRFPDESDNITSYFSGWADRFNSGDPEDYMDGESEKIYCDCLFNKYLKAKSKF